MFPQVYSPGIALSELDRVRQDNELLQKKLSKAIGKRNYYAKLYYSCMLERDKAMAEREGAMKELQRVLIQLQQHYQGVSPTSDCLSDASRLLSDSSSSSNPTATSLTPSRSISLASLLSLYPSANLHSPVEDSGLCTGGSTSSLATNRSSIEKESLNSSPTDPDTSTHATHTFEGTLTSPLLHSTAVSVLPFKRWNSSGPDVSNLLAECAEALEGIADLGLESIRAAESTERKNEQINYKQKSTQDAIKRPPMVSPILVSTASSRPKKAVSRSVKKEEHKFVDTFEMESVVWPRSQRDNRAANPGNITLPTSLLQEYAEDARSTLHPTLVKPAELHSIPKKYTRITMCRLDRIEEMSCESSVSDQSSEQKVMEQHLQQQMSADSFGEAKYNSALNERTDSTLTNKSKLSYRNLSTYEFRQILFELSASPDSVSHLEFFRSSFEDEWVLLLLCDEIRRNTSLLTLYLVECNLYMATDNLLQLLTAVSHSRLTYLSLARNGLTDRIVESFEVTELFSLHMSLKVLDLSENFLSVEAKNILNSISANCKCEILLHAQFSLPPRTTFQYQLL